MGRRVARKMIKRLVLPYRLSGCFSQEIYLFSCAPLDGHRNAIRGHMRLNECMNMIRHNNKRKKQIPLSRSVKERILYRSCKLRLCKKSRPMFGAIQEIFGDSENAARVFEEEIVLC